MAIFRVNKSKDYTVMSNHHLKNKDLSLKGKGLLSTMLSLPDDWDYSINGLIAILKENKTAVISTIKELETFGYLKRTRVQDEKGRFDYVYDIFETPCTENLCTDNLCSENVLQLNTKESNTNKLNTKDIQGGQRKKKKDYQSIIDEFTNSESLKNTILDFMDMRKIIKSPLTPRALTMLLNKLKTMSSNEEKQIEILNQSIINNWKSIYPLKDNNKAWSGKKAYKPQKYKNPDVDFDKQVTDTLKEHRKMMEEKYGEQYLEYKTKLGLW